MLYNWQIEFTNTLFTSTFIIFIFRPVGAGGTRVFMASPDFDRSVNRGGQIMPTILLLPSPPDF